MMVNDGLRAGIGTIRVLGLLIWAWMLSPTNSRLPSRKHANEYHLVRIPIGIKSSVSKTDHDLYWIVLIICCTYVHAVLCDSMYVAVGQCLVRLVNHSHVQGPDHKQ